MENNVDEKNEEKVKKDYCLETSESTGRLVFFSGISAALSVIGLLLILVGDTLKGESKLFAIIALAILLIYFIVFCSTMARIGDLLFSLKHRAQKIEQLEKRIEELEQKQKGE